MVCKAIAKKESLRKELTRVCPNKNITAVGVWSMVDFYSGRRHRMAVLYKLSERIVSFPALDTACVTIQQRQL